MNKLIVCFCIALVQLVSGEDGEISFKFNQPELTLKCSLTDEEVKWYKNGTEITEAARSEVKLSHVNGTHELKITKPKLTDIGSYTCEGKGRSSANFRVSMEPVVVELPTSFNVAEGEKFRLPCTVYGYPTPVIEWKRETESSWESVIPDGHFSLEDNKEGVSNGTLVIKDVKMEDRSNYGCFATNDLGSHNRTTLVRVIDKYAALWPFIGICVEVVVLCIVIFFCEKRRNKKQFEESDNEQNNTKHVGNAKDSEVRNRK